MRLIILPDAACVAQWSARYLACRVQTFAKAQQKLVLGLPTGGTIEPTYEALAQIHAQEKLSFSHVHTFNMDEYCGLPEDHPQSYHYFMQQKLFSKIDIPAENQHLPNGLSPDLPQAAAAYEAAIVESGGIELFLGGVGTDGHIAFNEPGSSLASRTRIKSLTQETILSNARFFDNDPSKVPTQAITVGIQTLLDAKEVLVLATGSGKAEAVHQAMEGSINHLWTITALQQHRKAVLVCDPAAVSELKLKTVSYFNALQDEWSRFTSSHFPRWNLRLSL